MRIALIGYGKMGHSIERILLQRGHDVSIIIDTDNKGDIRSEAFLGSDVAIEFTTPSTAFENVKLCIENQIPVVCGTTGWNEKLVDAKKLCEDLNGTFFYASNFSIGVNIFFLLNERLAQLMNMQGQYSVSMSETHHIHKKDAPSGTAVTLADGIIQNIERLNMWVPESSGDPTLLSVTSHREGEVPGIHEVKYESAEDIIKIHHEAKSRDGFAMGAVLAAEFALTHKGILSMKELLNL